MIRRLAPALLLLLLAVPPALPAVAAQPPRGRDRAIAVLRSVLVAPALIDYEGTKIISTRRDDRVETVTALEAHKRPNKTRLEFLSPEAVAGRLVVDSGVEAWHYEPSLHMAFQGPTLTPAGEAGADLAALRDAHQVTLLGTDEVIGRSVFVLSLAWRRDGGGRFLWVDQATGVPLRVEERRGGETVYAAYFTRISFSLNLPEALFRFRAPAGARTFSLFASEEGVAPLAQVERAVRFRVRTPASLPEGFRFVGAGVVRYGPVAAAQLRYVYGGAPVSLFQVPARRVADDGRQQGEVVTSGGVFIRVVELGFFRVLTWEADGVRLTIVGSPSRRALLALAAQMVRR